MLGLDVLNMLHMKSKIFRLGARNQNFKLRLLLHELFQEKLDLDFVFVFTDSNGVLQRGRLFQPLEAKARI